MGIALTEKAAAEVKRVLADRQAEEAQQLVLRVGVTGGGCSGFSYALGFDKEYDETKDTRYEQHGVTVVVDKKSALFLDGTTLDFFDDGLYKRGFHFDNPNAVKTCGCGSSFLTVSIISSASSSRTVRDGFSALQFFCTARVVVCIGCRMI